MPDRIGLIAGNGRFPILVAEEARKNGIEIVCIAIKGEADRKLKHCVDKIYWLGAGELQKLFQIFSKEDISKVVMAGQVKHRTIFRKDINIDNQMQRLLEALKDKRTDSLIGGVADYIENAGIKVLDSTMFLSRYLPEKGLLTQNKLDEKVLKDIEFGKNIAESIAGLDIGQSVVVKDMACLAVEAIEGTDEAIKRGARYAGEGIVVVKLSKPKQDMRFDVPTIGPDTIRLLRRLRAACIAIQAKKTIIIDIDKTISLANRYNIGVVAI